jgi:hypothetical protein
MDKEIERQIMLLLNEHLYEIQMIDENIYRKAKAEIERL